MLCPKMNAQIHELMVEAGSSPDSLVALIFGHRHWFFTGYTRLVSLIFFFAANGNVKSCEIISIGKLMIDPIITNKLDWTVRSTRGASGSFMSRIHSYQMK